MHRRVRLNRHRRDSACQCRLCPRRRTTLVVQKYIGNATIFLPIAQHRLYKKRGRPWFFNQSIRALPVSRPPISGELFCYSNGCDAKEGVHVADGRPRSLRQFLAVWQNGQWPLPQKCHLRQIRPSPPAESESRGQIRPPLLPRFPAWLTHPIPAVLPTGLFPTALRYRQ